MNQSLQLLVTAERHGLPIYPAKVNMKVSNAMMMLGEPYLLGYLNATNYILL